MVYQNDQNIPSMQSSEDLRQQSDGAGSGAVGPAEPAARPGGQSPPGGQTTSGPGLQPAPPVAPSSTGSALKSGFSGFGQDPAGDANNGGININGNLAKKNIRRCPCDSDPIYLRYSKYFITFN